MSRRNRILFDTTWSRDVRDAQEGARAFRAAHHLDWPSQRAGGDVFAAVARVRCITTPLSVPGAVVVVILEKIDTNYFSSPSSLQIDQPGN